jgi:hypothetical protein
VTRIKHMEENRYIKVQAKKKVSQENDVQEIDP